MRFAYIVATPMHGMLANIHVNILTAVTIFFLLSNLSQILDVTFLLPVSILTSEEYKAH